MMEKSAVFCAIHPENDLRIIQALQVESLQGGM